MFLYVEGVHNIVIYLMIMYEGKRVYKCYIKFYKIGYVYTRVTYRTVYLFIHTLGGVVVIMVVVIFT